MEQSLSKKEIYYVQHVASLENYKSDYCCTLVGLLNAVKSPCLVGCTAEALSPSRKGQTGNC